MKRQLNNFYIIAFPIISLLFMLSIALYLFKGSVIALDVLFVIGIIEMVLGKTRSELVFKNKSFRYLSLLFLLLPSGVALFFNNNTQGFKGSIIILSIILLLRCYLSLKYVKRSALDKLSKKKPINIVSSTIFIVGFIAITSLNIYFVEYYNHNNKVNWKRDITGALTSNIRVEDSNIKFLVNNDYLRRLDYNFPQTYTLNKNNGEIIDGKGGYQFEEEFKPFEGKIVEVTKGNIKIETIKNKIFIKNINDNKIIMSFITNGDILATPTIIGTNLYIISNNWSLYDKRKQVKIYSLDISEILIN